MNYLCNKRGILHPWVKWWLRFGNYRPKWIRCPMQENFQDFESGSSSGATHVPDRTSAILESQKLAAMRFWIPAWYTKLYGIVQETFLNDHLLKNDYLLRYSTTQRIWHHPSLGLRIDTTETERKERVEWKENRWVRRFNHLTSKVGVVCWIILVELMLTMVWWIVRESQFSEWNLGEFLTLWNCKAGKVNFRTEVCLRTTDPQIIMLWTKEVGIAKLIDELDDVAIDHKAEEIPLITICLMRWLRLHWKDFSTRSPISEKD